MRTRLTTTPVCYIRVSLREGRGRVCLHLGLSRAINDVVWMYWVCEDIVFVLYVMSMEGDFVNYAGRS